MIFLYLIVNKQKSIISKATHDIFKSGSTTTRKLFTDYCELNKDVVWVSHKRAVKEPWLDWIPLQMDFDKSRCFEVLVAVKNVGFCAYALDTWCKQVKKTFT